MSEIRTIRMTVTPALASEWIEADRAVHHNRRLNMAHVMDLVRQMREGRYIFSHQGIAIAEDGMIVDGQHRLEAIRISGVDVAMNVTTGLSREYAIAMQAVVDDGQKRSVSDAVRLGGLSDATPLHPRVAERIYVGLEGMPGPRLDKQLLFEILQKHWKAIDFAISTAFQGRRSGPVTQASVLAPVARAYYSQDRERLEKFGAVMITGEPEGKSDQAAIALRNALLKGSIVGRGAAGQREVYARTEYALQSFLAGERVNRLRGVDEELFQVPGENAWRKRAEGFVKFYVERQVALALEDKAA